MEWIDLTDDKQLDLIKEQSKQQPVIIFKYSTRCGTSSMIKSRLERSGPPPANTLFYFLDLIRYRAISNKIAQDYHVHHESPQVLVIRNGECIYDDSHHGINMQDIAGQVW
jgi:bacillithiol system protein YtxJ